MINLNRRRDYFLMREERKYEKTINIKRSKY